MRSTSSSSSSTAREDSGQAALRWHARYWAKVPDVGFEEAHAVLACLAGLQPVNER
jgi:hypothetical protein